ncbi:virulence protein [[Clostridium] innocuum]|nr:virulence protein [[Clostridium] innocuum]
MKVIYNITDRKPFVKALEEITGAKAVYMKTPTYAYTVDYFTVTREGNLTFNEMADSEEVERVLEELDQRGFHCESSEYDEIQPEVGCEELLEECPPAYGVPETEPQGETVGLTVALPLDQVLVDNLTHLLEAKGSLIKKALGISELPIEITEEQISFPWFSGGLDADTVKAYTNFIAALCKMSKEQKWISNIEKAVENEKYAFRCLLLRLGFVGAEYKVDRKILLKNLKGNSAFKSGAKKEAADDEISE